MMCNSTVCSGRGNWTYSVNSPNDHHPFAVGRPRHMENVGGDQVTLYPPVFFELFSWTVWPICNYQINNVNRFGTLGMCNKFGFWRYCPNLGVFPEPSWASNLGLTSK